MVDQRKAPFYKVGKHQSKRTKHGIESQSISKATTIMEKPEFNNIFPQSNTIFFTQTNQFEKENNNHKYIMKKPINKTFLINQKVSNQKANNIC